MSAALAALFFALARPPAQASELYFVDAHSQMDYAVDIETVVRLMDGAGVYRTFLSVRDGVEPHNILDFSEKYPRRVVPSVTTKKWGYVTSNPKAHARWADAVVAQHSSGRFRAMSEVLMWHSGCPNQKCPSVSAPPGDDRVDLTLEIALENGWPFIPHVEFGDLQGDDFKLYMDGLEKMLTDHPKHPFVLIHMGQLNPRQAGRLLGKYKNIHFLTTHSNSITFGSGGGFKAWIDMFAGERLTPAWKSLTVAYPTRFIFALDNVWGRKHWKPGMYNGQIALWRKALADLPHETAHAIAHGNAERLWRLEPKPGADK